MEDDDYTNLSRLYCDLFPFGWNLIRRGWKKGLPKDKPPFWVFCPQLKGHTYDRRLIDTCKKCEHFKNITKSERLGSLRRGEEKLPEQQRFNIRRPKQNERGFNIQKKQQTAKKRQYRQSDAETEEAINKDIIKQQEERKKWEEEEAKLMGNENDKNK